jgi:hypothetical protein
MFAYGAIASIVAKIQAHEPPALFTHEFLRFNLGFARESDRAFIPLAKRAGLLNPEGAPTALYLRLRDPAQTAAVIAVAMREGYPMFYAKNPAAQEIDRTALAALVAEVTGMPHGHASARAIVGTFLALQALAIPPDDKPVANRRKMVERRRGT